MRIGTPRDAILSLFLLWLLACGTKGCGSSSSIEGDPCEAGLDEQCLPVSEPERGTFARICQDTRAGGVCVNVCAFAAPDVGDGSEGQTCVFDDDCSEGLTCDNDRVGAEMPCLCIVDTGAGGMGGDGGSGSFDCSQVTPGNGDSGDLCRNDGDCADGRLCCTSTEVAEACGVSVGLCACT